MPKVQLEDGRIVEFENTPTPEDIDFVVSQNQQPQEKQSILPTLAGAGAGVATAGLLGVAASKAVPPLISAMKNTSNVWNLDKQANFAEGLQKTFVGEHSKQVKKFGGALTKLAKQNPEVAIDLSEFIGELNNPEAGISPQALSAFKKTPKLSDMIKNPELAKMVSLRDAQDIINHLNTKIPKEIKANNLDIIDAVNTVRAEQLQAFPQMAKVRAKYAAFKEPYKNIKRYFGFNRTIPAVEGDVPFGGAQGWKAAKQVLPKDAIKNIKGYRIASRTKELVSKPVKGIGRSLGVGKMLGVINPIQILLQAIDMQQQAEKAKKAGAFKISPFGEVIPVNREDIVS